MEYVTMIIATQHTACKLHRIEPLAWHVANHWHTGTGYVLASTGAGMVRFPSYTMRKVA